MKPCPEVPKGQPERGAVRATGLLRATLTLLAGGALAQALPLLLGPLLTRLYTPHDFGIYHLFAAVAANVAVIACARYEFALPLARDDDEAAALRTLCLRLLAAATMLSTLAAAAWAWIIDAAWPLWLPLAVAALGGVSLATLWATRAQRFRALAAGRVAQYGGASLLQAGAGAAHAGVTGLIVAPIVAALSTIALLRLPLPGPIAHRSLRDVARKHREFPLLNTPHAFAGALQDTLAVALIAATQGPAAAGFWGLTLRYLKAPATLVGGAVSQALYPKLAHAAEGATPEARHAVVRVMGALALIAAPLVLLLWIFAPWAFEQAFGAPWREAGELARSLALYIGVHFVAAPLAVVTMAWGAQAWALKLALVGQAMFVIALALGLRFGALSGAGWAVSLAMCLYFGWYFWKLATWPLAS
jgi:O-antigen/teichoic acid export membrane protein